MISNFIKALLLYSVIFISCCSYQDTMPPDLNIINVDDANKLNLKVAAYRVESNNKINSEMGSEIYEFEMSLKNSFNDWANKKFIPSGTKNNAVLYINQTKIVLKDIKKNEGIKKIISFEEKKTYLVMLELELKFIDTDNNSANLVIKGEIDLFIKDNTSINDRKRLLSKTIKNLVKAIDKSLNENIKKSTFENYYSKSTLY